MLSRIATLLAAALFVASFAGCGKAPSSNMTQSAMTRFDALPKSAQTALLAKNLLGMKVYSDSNMPVASMALQTLLENGAERSKGADSADLVVSMHQNQAAIYFLTITDKHGNRFTISTEPWITPAKWTQQVADTLGAERKIALLAR